MVEVGQIEHSMRLYVLRIDFVYCMGMVEESEL